MVTQSSREGMSEKIIFMTVFDLGNVLNGSDNKDYCKRAHLF